MTDSDARDDAVEATTDVLPDGVSLLLTPAEGIPPVVASPEQLRQVIDAFAGGTGPVAIDAERASGYRYGQRAYLVQLRRAGAGTALIDPIACPDLGGLCAAIADAEWVLHAANQDLPCLAAIGLRPRGLFDTELAGRLAGFPRVGLGAIVEQLLGLRLEKGHSAVDWSKRPLPEPWLRYAALDVEVLTELRNVLAEELDQQGKLEFALQEFAALVEAPPPAPRREPWRRTSGIHRVRSRRQLAALRALWEVRDELARGRDIAPGRLLPDSSLVAAATSGTRTVSTLLGVPGFGGRLVRRHADAFTTAIREAADLPEEALPGTTMPYDGPPPASRWAERDPAAAERLGRAREAVRAVAEQWTFPVENLLSPELVRRLAWDPPSPVDAAAVAERLGSAGARAWQIELTAAPIAAALAQPI